MVGEGGYQGIGPAGHRLSFACTHLDLRLFFRIRQAELLGQGQLLLELGREIGRQPYPFGLRGRGCSRGRRGSRRRRESGC